MTNFSKSVLLPALLCIALLLTASRLPAAPTNSFVYHTENGHIDADIESRDLLPVLEQIAMSTGWHVLLDPGARHSVSAKFTDLPTGQALHMLLGNVNFVVVPETNGTSRLYVFRNTQRQATKLVRAPAKPAKPIPRELIVKLKPGSKTKIEDLAKQLGAKIIGRMDQQNTYLLQFEDDAATQSAAAQLASNPDVSIDYNYPVDPPPQGQLTGNSTTPSLQLKPQPNNGNCQLMVGLIDTAIQPPPANISSIVKPALSVVGNYTPPAKTLTHGTAMLQTIAQAMANAVNNPANGTTSGSTTTASTAQTPGTVGTSVTILPVDVYGANESTSTFNVAQGVALAINNGANIINMSLGSSGDSSTLSSVIAQGQQNGVVFYAAAGNTPVTTATYPAAYPGVIAVTASGDNGQLASYANHGSFVQMMAPGDNIVPFDGQSWLVEGTSTATAFTTGLAAGLADAHHDCADQAQSLLKQSLGTTSIPAADVAAGSDQ